LKFINFYILISRIVSAHRDSHLVTVHFDGGSHSLVFTLYQKAILECICIRESTAKSVDLRNLTMIEPSILAKLNEVFKNGISLSTFFVYLYARIGTIFYINRRKISTGIRKKKISSYEITIFSYEISVSSCETKISSRETKIS
jgi:hypothetical protein